MMIDKIWFTKVWIFDFFFRELHICVRNMVVM